RRARQRFTILNFCCCTKGPQAAPRIERRAPWLTRVIALEDSSAPPFAAQLPSSERCRFFDQSRNRPDQPYECASATGPGFATTREEAPSLVEAVTRRSAVQKITIAAIDIISSR